MCPGTHDGSAFISSLSYLTKSTYKDEYNTKRQNKHTSNVIQVHCYVIKTLRCLERTFVSGGKFIGNFKREVALELDLED